MKAILFCTILFLGIGVKAQTINVKMLDSLFYMYEDKNKVYGNVQLNRGEQVLYNHSLGFQNIREKYRNDSETIYPLGRLTELFVQILFFQLQEEGKIHLSNKLSTYYNDIPNSEQITIENLLQNNSGINFVDSISVVNTRKSLVKHLRENPDFGKAKYSNLNYIILGFIIEDITGNTFSDLLKHRITDKLGLKNTVYKEDILDKHKALSYYKKNGTWKKVYNQYFDSYETTAGIYSNPHDLNILISALYQGKLISNKNLNAYFKHKKNNKKRIGLTYYQENSQPVYSLNRKMKGFNIQLKYIEKDLLAICVISNANDNMSLDFMANALVDSYYNRPIKFPNFSLLDRWKEDED